MYTTKFGFIVLIASLAIALKDDSEAPHIIHPTNTNTPLSVLLVTAPFAGHLLPFLTLGEELVKRGHNVTLVSAPTDFVHNEIGKRGISLWSIGEGFISVENYRLLFKELAGKDSANTFSNGMKVTMDFQKRVRRTIDNTVIKSFDIIIGDNDYFFSLMCFSHKWNIPSVYLSLSLLHNPSCLHAWPFPTANIGYTDNLTFFQRLVVVARNISYWIMLKVVSLIFLFREGMCIEMGIFPDEVDRYNDYHPQIITLSIGFEFSRTLLPFSHYVGPLISSSQPQLPQDIAEWLDGRDPRSVVYVSMGTTAVLTSAQAEMIINGAIQANLSVVWSLRKTNQHVVANMSYNHEKVMIADWIPQVTILRHPSIHSAVLHGGLGGIQEALSFGVPILVIPFLFDQQNNAIRVKHFHYGQMIYLHELSTPLVTQTLRVIGSELYRESIKKIQKIYKNDGGRSKAADLVEFYSDVGYEHLVPSYAKYKWSWIEFYNVDVNIVLIVAPLLLGYWLYHLIICSCSVVCWKVKTKVE